jgi:hypothetical protein
VVQVYHTYEVQAHTCNPSYSGDGDWED